MVDQPKTPDQLAESYGLAIGDMLPADTNFVLLVFNNRPIGQGGGIGWSTSVEAHSAVEVIRTFLASVDTHIKAEQQRLTAEARAKNGGG